MKNSISRPLKQAALAFAAGVLTTSAPARTDGQSPEVLCARWALAATSASPAVISSQKNPTALSSGFIAGGYFIEINSSLPVTGAPAPEAVKIEAYVSENAGGAPLVGPALEPVANTQHEIAALYRRTARNHFANCMASPGMKSL